MEAKPVRSWEFESCRVDADDGGRLWSGGKEVHLQPKALELLKLLVSRKGQIVTRSEIMESVWPETFVEEGNINFTVSCLRKVLRKHCGCDTEFIRTVPKTGYRFLPEVKAVEKAAAAPGLHSRDLFPSKRSVLLFAFVAVFLLTSFSIWWRLDRGLGISPVPLAERTYESIAILPPKPLSVSDDRELRFAVVDALASRIGSLNAVVVRPLSAALEFEMSDKDEMAFARSLDVDAVLSSTFIREGQKVRLNFRLQDARDQAVIWTDSVDVTDADVLKIQEVVSSLVAEQVALSLGVSKVGELAGEPTLNDDAYRYYLRGKYFLKNRSGGSISPADLFRKAIVLDPEFAEAYVGLADSLAFLEPPQEELENALSTAIELDPQLADAWATRGFVRMFHHWDWEGAERSFKKALELSPNDSKAHHWYGVYHSLNGDFSKARAEMTRALDLDPTSPFILNDLAELHYFTGDLSRAESSAFEMLELDPGRREPHSVLYKVRMLQGRNEESARHFLDFLPPESENTGLLRDALEQGGAEAYLRKKYEVLDCDSTESASSLSCAEVLVLLGRTTEATRRLRRAAEERVFLLPFVAVDPFWKQLENEPGYLGVLSRLRTDH